MLKRPGPDSEEAIVHYGDHDITIMAPGKYVRCAVSGVHIPLSDLRYWNADLQEAYASLDIAHARWKDLHRRD